MLRPTVTVGLGSSGLNVVSEVQKLMYETFGVNRLPIFRFLYIETDSSKSHEQTPAGSDIIPLTITVEGLQQAYRVLRNNPDLNMDWISEDLPSQLSYNAQGAGGVRPAGRLLLWGDGNFQKVYSAISNAYREIANPASRASLDPDLVQKAGGVDGRAPVVYVVGTLVGGTCSGSFIDIGYILRRATGMRESAPLYGIFIVPGTGIPLAAGYGNAYGALKEMEFFRDTSTFYEETWPNGVKTPPESLPPYAIIYLISPEYGRAGFSNMGLDGCLRVTGLRLFCDLIGLSAKRGAVLADGMNEGFGFYATYGISAILYPKYSLMEALGCAQRERLCDRWLMSPQYQSNTGESVSINESEILDDCHRFISEQLERVFSILNTKGAAAGGLEADVSEHVARVLSKEEDNPVKFFTRQFTAGREGNYYSAVKANVPAAQDHLITEIRNFVWGKLRETENFAYLQKLIDQFQGALQTTLDYWTKCSVPSTANEWNDWVSRTVPNRVFKNQQTWLGQKPNVLSDRIQNLLASLKMFCLRDALNLLKSSLEQGNLTTSNRAAALPTAERLEEARRSMQQAREQLRNRSTAITQEVSDVSVPIHRVWHSGSFEKDMGYLSEAYGRRYEIPSLSDVTNDPLWDVITARSPRALFAGIKVGYEARVREFLPAVDVVKEAIERIDLTREYADRALGGLLRLNVEPHKGRPGVPRFVLGAQSAPLNNMVTRLREAGLQDFKPGETGQGHVRELPLLEHAVVFYDEHARINPLTMLDVVPTMKDHFERPGVDSSGTRVANERVWRQQRVAYDVESRGLVKHITELMHFVNDFVVMWDKDVSDEWRIKGLRWEDFPVEAGRPLRFSYTESSGVPRDFPLDAEPRHLRQLAQQKPHVQALHDAVRRRVHAEGEDGLVTLWRAEINPYLARRYKPPEVAAKADFYFGTAGERNGLLYRLLRQD